MENPNSQLVRRGLGRHVHWIHIGCLLWMGTDRRCRFSSIPYGDESWLEPLLQEWKAFRSKYQTDRNTLYQVNWTVWLPRKCILSMSFQRISMALRFAWLYWAMCDLNKTTPLLVSRTWWDNGNQASIDHGIRRCFDYRYPNRCRGGKEVSPTTLLSWIQTKSPLPWCLKDPPSLSPCTFPTRRCVYSISLRTTLFGGWFV